MPASRFALLDSRIGRRLERSVWAVALVGLVVSAVTVAITLGGGSVPIHPLFVAGGVLALAAGQVLTIAIVVRRSGIEPVRLRERSPRAALATVRRCLFGRLPVVAVVATAVVFYGSLAVMALSMATGPTGQPVENEGGCRYGTNDHGEITCITRDEYDHARSSWERYFAAGLLAFFAVHVSVVGSDLVSAGSSEPSTSGR